MSRSRLDPNQIFQHAYDDANESLKMSLVGTEMQVALDADDGDSVQVQPRFMCQKVSFSEAINVEQCNSLKVYIKTVGAGSCVLQLQVSPLADGDMWVNMQEIIPNAESGISMAASAIEKVLAKRARIIKTSGNQDLDLYIVGSGN